MEFETLLRPYAAVAAIGHTRSVLSRGSTHQSSWAVVGWWVVGKARGLGIKEMGSGNSSPGFLDFSGGGIGHKACYSGLLISLT